MSKNRIVYSIQSTYILKPVVTSEKGILTCDERIDIPTIELLPNLKPILLEGQTITAIPCIELVCEFMSVINLTFETNEGVTVLPIKIQSGSDNPLENPYLDFRYVLVLPRGATGVKSCKITDKESGYEIQHNFTFGIMPPPYNYDNGLFSYLSFSELRHYNDIKDRISNLHLTTCELGFNPIKIYKGSGNRTTAILDGALFYKTEFNYPLSPEPTIHKPKITLHGRSRDLVYTLSLNKTANTVSIDLFTGMITAYDSANGEIIQQFKFSRPYQGLETLSFDNFDDIDTDYLNIIPEGALVK